MPESSRPDERTDAQLRAQCSRWMNGHRPARSMAQALLALAARPEAVGLPDVYGEGVALQALERRVADLLGKPAALFFHKGVAAQLAAMRVWAGEATGGRVALHRRTHVEVDEAQAYEVVLGLRGQRLGRDDGPFKVDELAALAERPSVVIVELPLRLSGFLLPDWDDLQAVSAWCREHQVPLHIDGARLWETAPHYQRSLADIAALADSVYVSFYKGLGGLAGCVLAGPEDFIERARPWKNRLAGNIYTVYPYVLSALDGLDRHLPRMAEWRERARGLAQALRAIDGARVLPDPPQVNSFQLHLPGEPAALREALKAVARDEGFWLAARAQPSWLAGSSMLEIVIGDAADDWPDEQLVALLGRASRQAVAGRS